MIVVDDYGLRRWQSGDVEMLAEHSATMWCVDYASLMPDRDSDASRMTLVRSRMLGDAAAHHEYVGGTMRQSWREVSANEIRGTFRFSLSRVNAFGIARIRFKPRAPVVDYYPRITFSDLVSQGGTLAFPSSHDRIGDTAWLMLEDGTYIQITAQWRSIVSKFWSVIWLWERYADGVMALHIILLDVSAMTRMTLTVRHGKSLEPGFSPRMGWHAVSNRRPVIQTLRVMAEHVTADNPYGYVNVRLDDMEQAREWSASLAQRAVARNAIGVIGWPWAMTQGAGLHGGRHEYPYHGGVFPPGLRQCMAEVIRNFERAGLRYGYLYRPYYMTVNSVATSLESGVRRYADETSRASIVRDIALGGRASLMYLDDFGFCPPYGHGSIMAQERLTTERLISYIRDEVPYALLFAEHASVVTLARGVGGYAVLQKQGASLSLSIRDYEWQELLQRYPDCSWVIGWSPWSSNPAADQAEVIAWCARQQGNVAPLLHDWLV